MGLCVLAGERWGPRFWTIGPHSLAFLPAGQMLGSRAWGEAERSRLGTPRGWWLGVWAPRRRGRGWRDPEGTVAEGWMLGGGWMGWSSRPGAGRHHSAPVRGKLNLGPLPLRPSHHISITMTALGGGVGGPSHYLGNRWGPPETFLSHGGLDHWGGVRAGIGRARRWGSAPPGSRTGCDFRSLLIPAPASASVSMATARLVTGCPS